MRRSAFLLLSAIVVLTVSQQNYQRRNIWVGPDDSPCNYGSGTKDKVNLVITVPGKETIKVTVESSTYCDPNILVSSQAINPSTFTDYVDSKADHHVELKEEPDYKVIYGTLVALLEITTIEKVKVYGRDDYDCVIVGDGHWQHWGVDFLDFDPATIQINCSEPSKTSVSELT